MSTLYPRLLPDAASQIWQSLQQNGPVTPSTNLAPSLSKAVFAATGGRRTTAGELSLIRADLVQIAGQAGMPEVANASMRASFDVAVARYLHERLDLSPGEASQRPVWSYFALVLAPDVCAWRFPPNGERGYFDERFRCVDVSRHALSRLWLRAYLLHDAEAVDPYELIGVLGEADMDQIISRRRDVASSRGLVQAIVRAYRDRLDETGALGAREVFRDSLKRLLRLAAFLDFDAMDSAELLRLVRTQREESRRVLAVTSLPEPQSARVSDPQLPRRSINW